MKTKKPMNNIWKERLLAAGIGAAIMLVVYSGVTYWLNNNTIRLQSPIVIEKKHIIEPKPTNKPQVSPAPLQSPTSAPKVKSGLHLIPQVQAAEITPNIKVSDKQAMVTASKYPDFIDHIWERESGRGSNTSGLAGTCLEKGMSNEFGFYPQGKWCFEDFQKAVERIELWREREAKGLTDNQALCYYNGAGKVESCAYLGYDFAQMH